MAVPPNQYLLDNPTFQYVEKTEHILGATDRYTYVFFDGMGRVYATETMGDEGDIIIVDTSFDSLGRVKTKSKPYRYGVEAPADVAMTYDGLSRVIITTYPDGTATSTFYRGLTREVQDQNGNFTVSTYDVYGRLKEVTDPSDTVTTYAYDTRGNLVQVVAALGMPEQNITTMTYDSLSKKRSIRDPDMGYWTYEYDRRGNLASQTDARGQTITYTYDAINRLLERNYSDYAVTNTYDDPTVPYSTGMLTVTSDSSSGELKEDRILALDVMQRVTRSKKTIGPKTVTTAMTYDSAGRVATRIFHPDTSVEKSFSYHYDWAGNLLAIQDIVTGVDHVQYADFTALGQPTIAVFPKSDGSFVRTTYTYDPLTSRLARLLTEKTAESTKTTACTVYTGEPTSTTTTYTCDLTKKTFDTDQGCENVCRRTGACNNVAAPITFSGSASTPTPYNTRDSVHGVAASGNTLNFTCGGWDVNIGGYDYPCGSITFCTNPVYACPYGSQYVCDISRVCRQEGTCTPKTGLTCPQGYTLTGSRCTASVCPLGDYVCSGTPSTCTGSGMDVESTLQDLTYQYDAKGNVAVVTDSVKGITHAYEYDDLNRLARAQGTGSSSYEQTYAYDRIGNITHKSDVGAYTYNYKDKPHAVRQAANIFLGYDANGNVTQRIVSEGTGLGVAWNQDNKPTLISKNGASYIRYTYDGSGQRVRKENLATGSRTLYFGDYEERSSTGVIHLSANGRRVASIRTDGRIQYYHGNHLGSASLITDQQGNVKETIEYMPFGTYRERVDHDKSFPNVNYTFTDQEDDDETGLYNYNARLYDPLLGRFISADSVIPEPGNLQAFNRYSYCVNNPLVYVDPGGHFAWLPLLIGAAIGALIGGITSDWNAQAMLIGAATGAITAGAFALAGEMIATMEGVVNAAATAQSGASIAYAATAVSTGAKAAIHAGAGAVSGAINAAITEGDIGMSALTSAVSAGLAQGLGRYIPTVGNDCADFSIGLAGRTAIGGVTGGVTSTIHGDGFGQGFQQGAATAGFAYLFNECGEKIHKWTIRITELDTDGLRATMYQTAGPGGTPVRPGAAAGAGVIGSAGPALIGVDTVMTSDAARLATSAPHPNIYCNIAKAVRGFWVQYITKPLNEMLKPFRK